MKISILKKLQGVYQPVNQHDRILYDHLNFSLEQTLHSHEYVGESVQTLRELCQMVILDVKQILVTCCDILEMLENVPSVSKKHECVDMSCTICSPVRKLAAYMDDFDIDPNNVTISMIQAECELIANPS